MNKRSRPFVLALCSPLILLTAIAFSATAGEPSIESRVFESENGRTMPYRILTPAGYDSNKTYPLVLCLHGAGGRGEDNMSRGTEAFKVLSSAAVQKEHPAFVLAPQCPKRKQWVNTPWRRGSYSLSKVAMSKELALVVQILDSVAKQFSIDSSRVYVTGQSMGGYGTWDVILRYPGKFAAAIPVCGAGDPTQAKLIADLPVWAFHGDKDHTVPVKGSRQMLAALKAAGSGARYTEYPGVGHDSWRKAWSEEELIPWLFQQQNKPDAGEGKKAAGVAQDGGQGGQG